MFLVRWLHTSHSAFLIFLLLAFEGDALYASALSKQIEKRAHPYRVVYDLPLGQPRSEPICVPQFGKPIQRDCERAAGGTNTSPPRGGMEYDDLGHTLSQYFRGYRRQELLVADRNHVLTLPRTYAFGKSSCLSSRSMEGFGKGFTDRLAVVIPLGTCIIALLTNPRMEDGTFDIAALNTIRWATVRMTRACGNRLENRLSDKGGWQVGGT